MPIPLALALAPAAIGAVGGLFRSAKQKREAKNINTDRPEYKIQKGYQQNVDMFQNQAQGNMGGYGLAKSEAFWISALFSFCYEYGIEAVMEAPSAQDLVSTPVLGYLVGVYFEDLRNYLKSKPGPPSTFDKILMATTDPLGYFNTWVNGWFGIQDNGNKVLVSFGYRNTTIKLDKNSLNPSVKKVNPVPTISVHYRW